MVTARDYRELSVQYYKWADEAVTKEVKDFYLHLAGEWTVAALVANSTSAALTSGVRTLAATRF
jgi:hypothetical protein